jgi:hypothetical protein
MYIEVYRKQDWKYESLLWVFVLINRRLRGALLRLVCQLFLRPLWPRLIARAARYCNVCASIFMYSDYCLCKLLTKLAASG